MNFAKQLESKISRWKTFLGNARPFIALALLLVVCMISNENFRSAQNLLNITRQVACTGIAALGMTLVITHFSFSPGVRGSLYSANIC